MKQLCTLFDKISCTTTITIISTFKTQPRSFIVMRYSICILQGVPERSFSLSYIFMTHDMVKSGTFTSKVEDLVG